MHVSTCIMHHTWQCSCYVISGSASSGSRVCAWLGQSWKGPVQCSVTKTFNLVSCRLSSQSLMARVYLHAHWWREVVVHVFSPNIPWSWCSGDCVIYRPLVQVGLGIQLVAVYGHFSIILIWISPMLK